MPPKKVAKKVALSQATEYTVYDNKSAFSMDNLTQAAATFAVSEYYLADMLKSYMTDVEMSDYNKEMLADLLAALGADFAVRKVMGKQQEPWMQLIVKYSVANNLESFIPL